MTVGRTRLVPSVQVKPAQAEAVLTAAESSPLHAYVVLSLLIGAIARSCGR